MNCRVANFTAKTGTKKTTFVVLVFATELNAFSYSPTFLM